MATRKSNAEPDEAAGANVGYETELWRMADIEGAKLDAAIAANLRELGYGG